MAKISVVVPVYNVEDYLDWCLASLEDQTLKDIEIIAVNDGSTDASPDILRRYAEKDKRMKIIDKENGGLSSARNAGILAATAPIVCFLDSDDRFTPDACETIVNAFGNDEGTPVDVVTFGARCYPEEGGYPWMIEHLSPRDIEYSPFDADVIFKEMSRPFAWRTACRTDFLKDNGLFFDEDVKFGEDQVFHFAIYPRSKKTRLISDKLYDYRLSREGSLMSKVNVDSEKKMLEHVKIMRAIFSDWKAAGLLERYGREMADWTIEFAGYEILSIPSDKRGAVASSFRAFLREYWTEEQIKAMELPDAISDILLALLSEETIGDIKARSLQYLRSQSGGGQAQKDSGKVA